MEQCIPCHATTNVLNKSKDRDDERSNAEKTSFISAKAIQRRIQRGSSDDRVFLGLIRKVDEGTENEALGGPSDVEKLRRPDLALRQFGRSWNHIQMYSPSELPKGVPLVRMGHEFKIDLEDETPPIHRPLYTNSVHSSSLKPKIKSKKCWSTSSSVLPILLMAPRMLFMYPRKMASLRFCIDYRWLNKHTIQNRYPLPLPEEMLDRLGGARVFSKIDLNRWGTGKCRCT